MKKTIDIVIPRAAYAMIMEQIPLVHRWVSGDDAPRLLLLSMDEEVKFRFIPEGVSAVSAPASASPAP